MKVTDLNKPKNIPETDINAFMGRQSFIGGLKLPLKESIKLSDEEYELLFNELRKIKQHIVHNLPDNIPSNYNFSQTFYNNKTININISDHKINLYTFDIDAKVVSQRITLKEARTLLKREPFILYTMQDEISHGIFKTQTSYSRPTFNDIIEAYAQGKNTTSTGIVLDDDLDFEI